MRWILALIGAWLAGCATHTGAPDAPPPGPAVRTAFARTPDIVYTPAGWPEALKADLYLPRAADRAAPPWPVVLLLHGGGWAAPDRRSQMATIAEQLAARGYAVLNASYRFAPQHVYPAQIDDLREAVRWLRREAPRLGLDPQRLAVFGYSAGGHLAALLGALPGPADVQVQAVVAGGAPTDLRKYQGGKLVPQFLGGGQAEVPQRYREASPITHVRPGLPPVFLYHGGWDTLVPLDHATDYQAALQQAGVPVELFVLRGRGHITAFFTDGPAVDAAIAFLDRRLRPAR